MTKQERLKELKAKMQTAKSILKDATAARKQAESNFKETTTADNGKHYTRACTDWKNCVLAVNKLQFAIEAASK